MSRTLFLLLLVICAASAFGEEQNGANVIRNAKGKPSPWVADAQTVLLFEMGVAALVFAFIFVFILGTYKNLSIARKITDKLSDILSMQFAQIGDGGKKMVKDGQSFYWFHATGRRNTSGLTVFIDLAKRMDIFSYTSSFMATPQRDRLIFYLPLPDVAMEPISLFLVKRKELARLKTIEDGQALAAVEALAAEVIDVSGIPGDFVTMTEHAEIVSALLPERTRALVAEHGKYLLSIHVTEQGARWDSQCKVSKKLVRIEFFLPLRESQMTDVLQGMCQMAINLIDAIPEMKLSGSARKKAVDLRRKVVAEVEKRIQKARAEIAAEKRAQKKKDEEEAVGKMSREKQIKYEEKKRKKEVTSRMRKSVRK